MLLEVVHLLKSRMHDIDAWFSKRWGTKHPPLYFSSDIRHSGFKIGVVDTNAFPAGFNNLCTSFSQKTQTAFDEYFDAYHPDVGRILLYGEEHTRNKYYLKNLHHLHRLLSSQSRQVRMGFLGLNSEQTKLTIDLEDKRLDFYKILRSGDQISLADFNPQVILSNNDFTSGCPELFCGITQTIIPSPDLGWFKRKKNHHFSLLHRFIDDFSSTFGLDPWLLYPYTDSATLIDFFSEPSLQGLAQKVQVLLDKVQLKYDEHKIKESPYVYLKNNSGTYGLGLLPVFSGDEILSLNRRKRNRLLSSKEGNQTADFFIQEGIPTVDFYSGYPIEPVIYGVGKRIIGGFFRIHESKNEMESLNAPGMTFSCLCLHKLDEPHEEYFLDCKEKEEVVQLSQLLARLAALALSEEQVMSTDS